MDVVLSIKPKYVESIVKGQKRYEFRRAIFTDPNVERVYMYATSPLKRIIGYFVIREITKGSPEDLWTQVRAHAGIDEREFFAYFSGGDVGYAIGIGDVHSFEEPLDPQRFIPGFRPPQNFMYAPEHLFLSH